MVGRAEQAVKNGHRDCVASSTGRIETETVSLGGVPERTKATGTAVRRSRPKRGRDTLHAVGADREAGGVNAAKEVLGTRVKSGSARVHGTKRSRSGWDRRRKQE